MHVCSNLHESMPILISTISLAHCALNPNWRLIWSDEFDGPSLDTTKWTVCYRTMELEKKVMLKSRFKARNVPGNYGNKELQWYHPDCVNVSNGHLVITSNDTEYGVLYLPTPLPPLHGISLVIYMPVGSTIHVWVGGLQGQVLQHIWEIWNPHHISGWQRLV